MEPELQHALRIWFSALNRDLDFLIWAYRGKQGLLIVRIQKEFGPVGKLIESSLDPRPKVNDPEQVRDSWRGLVLASTAILVVYHLSDWGSEPIQRGWRESILYMVAIMGHESTRQIVDHALDGAVQLFVSVSKSSVHSAHRLYFPPRESNLLLDPVELRQKFLRAFRSGLSFLY